MSKTVAVMTFVYTVLYSQISNLLLNNNYSKINELP